jgi:hypothetical protein
MHSLLCNSQNILFAKPFLLKTERTLKETLSLYSTQELKGTIMQCLIVNFLSRNSLCAHFQEEFFRAITPILHHDIAFSGLLSLGF